MPDPLGPEMDRDDDYGPDWIKWAYAGWILFWLTVLIFTGVVLT